MDKPAPKNQKSRRQFLSVFSPRKSRPDQSQMIKMLTADGRLVEVSKEVVQAATKNQKATNKDIYNWMNNPSKENS